MSQVSPSRKRSIQAKLERALSFLRPPHGSGLSELPRVEDAEGEIERALEEIEKL